MRSEISLLLPLLVVSGVAYAEGSADLAPVEQLLPETTLFVDILDASTELIVYRGDLPADIFGPGGEFIATVFDGDTATPSAGNGAYRVFIHGENNPTTPRIATMWDVDVPTRQGGRVWSTDWRLNAGTFSGFGELNRSFFALVDGGSAGRDGVVELSAQGFAGYVFRINGNRTGLQGESGRSVPVTGQVFDPEFAIYLEPPERAERNPMNASVPALTVDSAYGDCNVVAPDVAPATITFNSPHSGTWHLICDLNRDGVFSMVDDADLHRLGALEVGANTISYNGGANDGSLAPPGTYNCIVRVAVGELHWVAYDVETAYPGFRMFHVTPSDLKDGLTMFWNDIEVQANDITMPSGVPSPMTSGPNGVPSGAYNAASDPLVNSRGWGRFRKGSKGDEAWLDTYAWLSASDSAAFPIEIVDGAADTDGDGLLDVTETCRSGTDPLNPDTDGDGLSDFREVRQLPTDPLNPDSDGDCLLDGEEVPAIGQPGDVDSDGLVDPLDDDDDDDGILTADEMCNLLTGVLEGERDVDGDGSPNHVDRDADGDQYSDTREGVGDRDNDTRPDFLDRDTVGLGVFDPDAGYYAGGCNTAPGGLAGLVLVGALARRRRR